MTKTGAVQHGRCAEEPGASRREGVAQAFLTMSVQSAVCSDLGVFIEELFSVHP